MQRPNNFSQTFDLMNKILPPNDRISPNANFPYYLALLLYFGLVTVVIYVCLQFICITFYQLRANNKQTELNKLQTNINNKQKELTKLQININNKQNELNKLQTNRREINKRQTKCNKKNQDLNIKRVNKDKDYCIECLDPYGDYYTSRS